MCISLWICIYVRHCYIFICIHIKVEKMSSKSEIDKINSSYFGIFFFIELKLPLGKTPFLLPPEMPNEEFIIQIKHFATVCIKLTV